MTTDLRVAAVIGGGVIGAGWAARMALHGVAVRVYDPSAAARARIADVMIAARAALEGVLDAPLPIAGAVTFSSSIAEAVAGVDFVQECAPERLELKREVFAAIAAAAPADAVIGSSTSGYRPSELQDGCAAAPRMMVTHPFNPVYLLPLCEIVPGGATDAEAVDRAVAFVTQIGMKPLRVRKEIDAHIADRFLEAVWREALWLVKDGVATTEEIDDAIRYGFGLRWAQMGLFETYRIAGGDAGMRHFIAQFGPHLSSPWTKLMDVPELDAALVETIATQSDAQARGRSIRELERIRDDNLVGILRALKSRAWGAGETFAVHEARLTAQACGASAANDVAPAPGAAQA